MKKRLLISSVLMSAVLACALGTGTYAWYTASAAQLGLGATKTTNISTGHDEAFSAVNLDVEWSEIKEMALTDTSGNSYVLVNGTKTKYTPATDLAKQEVTITISSTTVNWSEIAGNYTITIAATGAARIDDDQNNVFAEVADDKVSFDVIINEKGIGKTAPASASNSVTHTFWISVAGAEDPENSVTAGLEASIALKA